MTSAMTYLQKLIILLAPLLSPTTSYGTKVRGLLKLKFSKFSYIPKIKVLATLKYKNPAKWESTELIPQTFKNFQCTVTLVLDHLKTFAGVEIEGLGQYYQKH